MKCLISFCCIIVISFILVCFSGCTNGYSPKKSPGILKPSSDMLIEKVYCIQNHEYMIVSVSVVNELFLIPLFDNKGLAKKCVK
jgi:hypothetical protein